MVYTKTFKRMVTIKDKHSQTIKESFSFKTRMPGTVKCRPTVAY